MSHEVIHTIRKANVERMIVKLGIKKAYEKVDRYFLLQVIARFGFFLNGSLASKFVSQPPNFYF